MASDVGRCRGGAGDADGASTRPVSAICWAAGRGGGNGAPASNASGGRSLSASVCCRVATSLGARAVSLSFSLWGVRPKTDMTLATAPEIVPLPSCGDGRVLASMMRGVLQSRTPRAINSVPDSTLNLRVSEPRRARTGPGIGFEQLIGHAEIGLMIAQIIGLMEFEYTVGIDADIRQAQSERAGRMAFMHTHFAVGAAIKLRLRLIIPDEAADVLHHDDRRRRRGRIRDRSKPILGAISLGPGQPGLSASIG